MKTFLSPALLFMLRNWKSGELRLISFAVFMAVACVTSLVFLTESIRTGLENKSGFLLGSDSVISSLQPLSSEFAKKAHEFGLRTCPALNFLTMVSPHRKTKQVAHQGHMNALTSEAPSSELALADVHAVGKNYPLRGELRVADQLFAADRISDSIPKKGTVWLEARLFSQLNLEVGDEILIGSGIFKVAFVLTNAPSKTLEGINMAPQIMINEADVPVTKILQPGSRVTYKLLIAGQEGNLKQFEGWAAKRLNATETFVNSKQSRPVLTIALQRADHYLGLIFLVNAGLAGVAIAMVTRRFSRKQFDTVAILRCFGASSRWIFNRYLSNLLLLGLIAGILGTCVGYVIYSILTVLFLEEIFFKTPSLAVGIPIIVGLCTVFSLLLGFALPPLLQLQKISPLRVLRKDLEPPNLSNRLAAFSAILAVIFLIVLQTHDIELTTIITLSTLGISVVVLWILYKLLHSIFKMVRFLKSDFQITKGITRRGSENALQILVFSLVLTLIGVLFLTRTDLLKAWKDQIPLQAPNYFVINIPPDLLSPFRIFLQENSVINVNLYPMMLGRLMSVNQEPVKMQAESASSKQRVFTRFLNLTWSSQLQDDNRIIEGQWFNEQDKGRGVISVERGFADRLNIKLGDKLEFQISEKRVIAEVISIRTVEWDSFQPNFYVIFPPGILENLPKTYMTSFYLPENKLDQVKRLVQHFPMVNVIDTKMIVNQLGSFFNTISYLVEVLWGFTLITSFILLSATIISTLDERREEALLLRILGANHRQLLGNLLSEFLLLGLLAGLIASISANGIMYWLVRHLFDLPYRVNYLVLFLMPVVGMALLGAGGWIGTRSLLLTSVLRFFR